MASGLLNLVSYEPMVQVAVINYGIGNLYSIFNALTFIKAEPVLVSNPSELKNYKLAILPGVGSFRLAMDLLHKKGFYSSIKKFVSNSDSKILGICLGFQMLGMSSTEDGFTEGLGLIPGYTEKFNQSKSSVCKIPHIGFNTVRMPLDNRFFDKFNAPADFYFVHSYRMQPLDPLFTAYCDHGDVFSAAYHKHNIYGTQFHPEKSQTNGLILLSNFLSN